MVTWGGDGGAKRGAVGESGTWASYSWAQNTQPQAASSLRTEPLARFDQRASKRKNKRAGNRQGNPGDGRYGVLGPRARLPSEGKRITSRRILGPGWEKPVTAPSSPTESLIVRLCDAPRCFPTSHPGLRADASPPFRCSSWREPWVQKGPRCALLGGPGGGSAPRRLEPGPRAAASPRRCPPTPLAPSAARVSPPLFGNL